MNTLLNESPLFLPQKTYPEPTVKDKGNQIMEGLLLSQYRDSANLKEYFMAFISEMDYLFEQIEEAYIGRFLENAIGAQLDVIGIILQQTRAVILPVRWFGFQGAFSHKMADKATPDDGGVFRDGNLGNSEVTPLDDAVYRRLLTVRAIVSNRDTADFDLAYYLISIVLGRVPSTLEIRDEESDVTPAIPNKTVNLVLSASDTTDRDLQLIFYISKYFVPTGITFTITQE